MKRYLWKMSHPEQYTPPWSCSECGKGLLQLIPKSLVYKETHSSKLAHREEAWDPDWVEHVYSAWLKCTNPTCGQDFALSGVGGVEQQYNNEEGTMDWQPYFSPKWCSPMPAVFEFPAKCPEEVKEQLKASFRLLWADHAASASKVRVALEYLMDHLGVPKRRKDRNSRFTDLTLHKRVEIFQNREPIIGSQLMALKWLGNIGSHEAQISCDDLLDSFEILEHALSELIDRRSTKVAELAKKLTRKHAPKRKK